MERKLLHGLSRGRGLIFRQQKDGAAETISEQKTKKQRKDMKQCSDPRVSDKETYPTTARTRPPSTKISKSVVSLLLRFGWDRIVMVRSTKKEWSMIADAIRDLALAHGVDVHKSHNIGNYLSFSHKDTLNEIARTRESTRVYVFVGEHILLVDFVEHMYVSGYLSTGKYAIIAVDEEIYVPDVNPEWYMVKGYANPLRDNRTLDKEALKNIYEPWRSVLKLTPSHPTRADYKEIMNKIKNASREDPFNVPIHPTILKSMKVPVSAAHAYDAVLMYARAVTEVLAAKDDPTNGTAVLQRIRGHNFMSLRGYTVHVDENGDAEGNYSVVSLLPDESGNSTLPYRMLPVGYFSTKDGQNTSSGPASDLPEFRYLNPSQGIQWVLGHPPEAHPPCGFDGKRCSIDPDPMTIVLLTLAVCVVLVAAIFAFRHYRHELKLACLLWKIDLRSVQLLEANSNDNFGGQQFKPATGCIHQRAGNDAREEARSGTDATYCRIGIYKGTIVAVKFINKKSVDLTRSIRKELKLVSR
ncbi:guanylate cyclase 32E-like, partial [Amphibalanus amphitrite]|uniref:guanylate cyclase 32E-like n=1 Tax=Amphibalanus amphitrite TaxID=1232801 RepID=UPI001C902B8D